MDRPQLLSFDCYGTLIDWWGGVSLALSRLGVPPGEHEAIFDRYVSVEMEVEAGPYLSYREVTARALEGALRAVGRQLPPDRRSWLADSIPEWEPFPETVETLRELHRDARLAILSNIDDDLLEASVRKLGVPIAHRVTAEQVRAYKPAHAHFLTILERTGLRPEQVLHVGASLGHDMRPCRDLGIPGVWINRRGEPVPDWFPTGRTLPDLRGLAGIAFGS